MCNKSSLWWTAWYTVFVLPTSIKKISESTFSSFVVKFRGNAKLSDKLYDSKAKSLRNTFLFDSRLFR